MEGQAESREGYYPSQDSVDWEKAWGEAQAEALRARLAQHRTAGKVAALRRRAQRAEKRLAAIQVSPWWRVTGPARRAVGKLKSDVKARSPRAAVARAQPGGELDDESAAKRIDAVARRLQTVLSEFDLSPGDDELSSKLRLVTQLLSERRDTPGFDAKDGLLWLLYVAFAGTLPDPASMESLEAELSIDGPRAVVDSLRRVSANEKESWALYADLRLCKHPLVDVTHTARFEIHTGIQRVVREAAPRWVHSYGAELAVFDEQLPILRPPSKPESDHVMQWTAIARRGYTVRKPVDPFDAEASPGTILVLWKSVLILPEITAEKPRSERLVALARWSGSTISAIFYDLIPYSLPEACADETRVLYSDFISIIRVASRVSAISQSAADDLKGFCVAIRNTGVPGPDVQPNILPVGAMALDAAEIERNAASISGAPGLPIVLSVGSIEPRKNHVRTLRAAERLWREGHSFQLVFIAGGGWKKEQFEGEFAKAQARGRPIRVIRTASESTLWSAYRLARFTVFVSLAEGFGLPAAESIAAGTPVVLSNIGSMLEIGKVGGAELVNPYDLDEITDAMRRLLTDDSRLAELRSEAAARPTTSWDDYAKATWNWLMKGEKELAGAE